MTRLQSTSTPFVHNESCNSNRSDFSFRFGEEKKKIFISLRFFVVCCFTVGSVIQELPTLTQFLLSSLPHNNDRTSYDDWMISLLIYLMENALKFFCPFFLFVASDTRPEWCDHQQQAKRICGNTIYINAHKTFDDFWCMEFNLVKTEYVSMPNISCGLDREWERKRMREKPMWIVFTEYRGVVSMSSSTAYCCLSSDLAAHSARVVFVIE